MTLFLYRRRRKFFYYFSLISILMSGIVGPQAASALTDLTEQVCKDLLEQDRLNPQYEPETTVSAEGSLPPTLNNPVAAPSGIIVKRYKAGGQAFDIPIEEGLKPSVSSRSPKQVLKYCRQKYPALAR